MKAVFALVFIASAVLCAINAKHVAPNGVDLDKLYKELSDFKRVLPLKEISEIYEKHRHDPEIVKALNFLKSHEMNVIGGKLANSKENQAIFDFLVKEGWYKKPELLAFFDDDADENVETDEQVDDELPLKSFRARLVAKNFEGVIDEVLAILPKEKISKMIKEKLITSHDFKVFYELITNKKLSELVDALFDEPENRKEWNKIAAHGIDFKKIILKLRAYIKQLH